MLTTVGSGSFLFVPVLQGDNIKERRLNEQSIYNIVKEYGVRLGVPTLAPHDLRRTHARLGRDAGADLDQIQAGLGHASVTTTQAYVGGNQNLQRAPGDMIDVDWTGNEGKE
jgi:integrase